MAYIIKFEFDFQFISYATTLRGAKSEATKISPVGYGSVSICDNFSRILLCTKTEATGKWVMNEK
jgi:hypothetical protein